MQRDQAHRTNELLERIAVALEKNNKKETVKDIPLTVTNDLATSPEVYESKENKLDYNNVYREDDIHNDYLSDLVKDMTSDQYDDFHRENSLSFALNDAVSMTNFIYSLEYEECLGAIKQALAIIDTPTSDNPDPAGYGNKEYETDLQGIRVDDDHDIRLTAHSYEAAIDENLHTKKDCILDYVTNEFGILGARYTDIIKFAYYLGSPNAPKYTSANRGYYSCAFSYRMNGHLIMGGKDYLVKGINSESQERYYALSKVNYMTDYWKRIGRYER